jgi:hypothetical protein
MLILPIATKLPLGPRGRVEHQNTTLTLHAAGDASTVQAVRTCWMSACIATTTFPHLPIKSIIINCKHNFRFTPHFLNNS